MGCDRGLADADILMCVLDESLREFMRFNVPLSSMIAGGSGAQSANEISG